MSTLKQPDDNFLGEVDTMDFSPIRNKQFIVAVNHGERQQAGLIPESIKGPYNFYQMVEEVGNMWKNDSHHAKVMVLNGNEYADWLDESTIDAIEAKFIDILFQEAFQEVCGSEPDPDTEYACGIVKNEGPVLPTKEQD